MAGENRKGALNMELTYRTEGDYRLPNLEAPEAPKVGKYGMLRRSYLQTHRNAYYTGMLLSGRLNAHLEKIDRQAAEMVEHLTVRMAQRARPAGAGPAPGKERRHGGPQPQESGAGPP